VADEEKSTKATKKTPLLLCEGVGPPPMRETNRNAGSYSIKGSQEQEQVQSVCKVAGAEGEGDRRDSPARWLGWVLGVVALNASLGVQAERLLRILTNDSPLPTCRKTPHIKKTSKICTTAAHHVSPAFPTVLLLILLGYGLTGQEPNASKEGWRAEPSCPPHPRLQTHHAAGSLAYVRGPCSFS
jgi:hypothetical protein